MRGNKIIKNLIIGKKSRIPFGKYEGKTFEKVANVDPKYVG